MTVGAGRDQVAVSLLLVGVRDERTALRVVRERGEGRGELRAQDEAEAGRARLDAAQDESGALEEVSVAIVGHEDDWGGVLSREVSHRLPSAHGR